MALCVVYELLVGNGSAVLVDETLRVYISFFKRIYYDVFTYRLLIWKSTKYMVVFVLSSQRFSVEKLQPGFRRPSPFLIHIERRITPQDSVRSLKYLFWSLRAVVLQNTSRFFCAFCKEKVLYIASFD